MDMISFLVCEVGNKSGLVPTLVCSDVHKGFGVSGTRGPPSIPWIVSRGIIAFSLGRIGQLLLLLLFQLTQSIY